jgi:hypothetical protein
MFLKTNDNKFNKQTKMQQTSRHGVTFSMFSLSTASLSRTLRGVGGGEMQLTKRIKSVF